MGMDLHGASGNYFRANCWSWRPIHDLCVRLSRRYKLGLDFTMWDSNDGAGLHNQEDCDALALAIETELFKHPDRIYRKECRLRVDENGSFLPEGSTEGKSSYETEPDHLREFVKFLLDCGGSFEID